MLNIRNQLLSYSYLQGNTRKDSPFNFLNGLIRQKSKLDNLPSLAPLKDELPNTEVAHDPNENLSGSEYYFLESIHDQKIKMSTPLIDYYILGDIEQNFKELTITLALSDKYSGKISRIKIDLYVESVLNSFIYSFCENYDHEVEQVKSDLTTLTNLLEKKRDLEYSKSVVHVKSALAQETANVPKYDGECIQFLKSRNLMESLNDLIGHTGIIGFEKLRLVLFLIGFSYKSENPLHALLFGSSGKGKRYLLESVLACFPQEDVILINRITAKSLYHVVGNDLVNKIIVFPNENSIDDKMMRSFQELQENKVVTSSITSKDRNGNLISSMKRVSSKFASFIGTQSVNLEADKFYRTFLLGINEDDGHNKNVICYTNKLAAGKIDLVKQNEIQRFIQQCVRTLKPHAVVNPFADIIQLPLDYGKIRRINDLFQGIIIQITLLNQFQRETDRHGRLLSTLEDIELALDFVFEFLLFMLGDLNSSHLVFYKKLIQYVQSNDEKNQMHDFVFTQRDIRMFFGISKSVCFRYLKELETLEYIHRCGGSSNKGFRYKINNCQETPNSIEEIIKNIKIQIHQLAQ